MEKNQPDSFRAASCYTWVCWIAFSKCISSHQNWMYHSYITSWHQWTQLVFLLCVNSGVGCHHHELLTFVITSFDEYIQYIHEINWIEQCMWKKFYRFIHKKFTCPIWCSHKHLRTFIVTMHDVLFKITLNTRFEFTSKISCDQRVDIILDQTIPSDPLGHHGYRLKVRRSYV